MKEKFLFIFFLFVTTISCHQEDVIYSCDPDIDMIVKSGHQEFLEISLKDFLEYDIELQRAIYRSFSVTKKISFWSEKLDSITINNKNIEEVNHINKLRLTINSDLFIQNDIQFTDNIELTEFIESWTKHAKNELNWTTSKIHFVAYSLYFDENQYSLALDEYKDFMMALSGGNCVCNTVDDDCSSIELGTSCTTWNCAKTLSGCGFLHLNSCNGACL